MRAFFRLSSLYLSCLLPTLVAAHGYAAPTGTTSLTNPSITYTTPDRHYAVLKRGDVTAVIVDNAAVDNEILPGHRGGYNGVASLTHTNQPKNLFEPTISGLNFEHIHDGTLAIRKELFEPRKSHMQLRLIDEHTVELYQAPTKNWQLESCGRYHLLVDGTIEYTFECIPRADTFQQGYIGLFWASYILSPEDKSIWFRGTDAKDQKESRWIRGVTPEHGVESTHPPAGALPELPVHEDFPLTLVNHRSKFVYTEPWYYGVSHEMAYVLMFRPQDRVWFAQSPTGGGPDNPAWDFQWFIPNYKVGEAYGFVMRASYLPFSSREQIEQATRVHRKALAK